MPEMPNITIFPAELEYIPLEHLRDLRRILSSIETGLKHQYRHHLDTTLQAALSRFPQNYDLIDTELLRRTEPSRKEA